MTSPTGTTNRPSTHSSENPVPPIVSSRRRAVLGVYIGLSVILVSAALCFVDDFAATMVYCLGVCFTSGCLFGLRRSTRREDLRPDDELDEYELQRRYHAQQRALTYATVLLFIVWIAFALLTTGFRMAGPDSFDTLIATLHACYLMTTVAILLVPFMIVRDIAGGMNRDLIISEGSADIADATNIRDTDAMDATAVITSTAATATTDTPSTTGEDQ